MTDNDLNPNVFLAKDRSFCARSLPLDDINNKRELEKENNYYKSEIFKLKEELRGCQSMYEYTEETLRILDQVLEKNRQLTKQFEILQKTHVYHSNNDSQNQDFELKSYITELEKKNRTLEMELKKMDTEKSKIQNIVDTNEELNRKLGWLQSEKERMVLEDAQNQDTGFKTYISELEKKNQTLEIELKKMDAEKSKIQYLVDTNEELNRKLGWLQSEKKRMVLEVSDFQKENYSLKDKMGKMEDQNKAVKKENHAVYKVNESLRTRISHQEKEIEGMKPMVAFNNTRAALEDEMKKLRIMNDQLKRKCEENRSFKEEQEKMNRQMFNNDNRNRVIGDASLILDANELRTVNANLKRSLDEKIKELEVRHMAIISMKEKIKSFDFQGRLDLTNKISDLENEINHLKIENKNLNEEVSNFKKHKMQNRTMDYIATTAARSAPTTMTYKAEHISHEGFPLWWNKHREQHK